MNSVTIQINSLEALERLIGNDAELEINLRNAIVQEFAKKHLKAVAQSEYMLKAEIAIKAELEKIYFDKTPYGKPIFKPEHLTKLRENLEDTASIELGKIVSEIVDEQNIYSKIQARVNKAVDRIERELSDDVIKTKLERLVDLRLKEKLGIK